MILKTKNNIPQNRFSISMTPLIDIIFLLMIFFLMNFNFNMPEVALKNRLPQLGRQESSDPTKDWETVRLRIKMVKEDGSLKILLQERSMSTFADLAHYLDQLPDDILIIMDPVDSVPYKHVIGAYNTCLESSKKNIVFSISQ